MDKNSTEVLSWVLVGLRCDTRERKSFLQSCEACGCIQSRCPGSGSGDCRVTFVGSGQGCPVLLQMSPADPPQGMAGPAAKEVESQKCVPSVEQGWSNLYK